MSRTILLSLVLLSCSSSQAQSWCPPGAEWTFHFDDFMGGQFGVMRVEHAGDTLLDGHQAQRLEQWVHAAPFGTQDYVTWSYGEFYTRYEDGIVYQWVGGPEQFDTLFWFGAAPGDRWNTINGDGIELVVTDTTTMMIDAVPLRRLIVEFEPGMWVGTDTLYERMGFSYLYLAGYTWFLLDMPMNGLRCYRDDDINYTAPGVTDCGYTLSVHDIGGEQVLPSPNPGTDHFTLQLPAGVFIIELINATGQRVGRERANGGSVRVNTSDLAPGLLTYRVTTPEGTSVARGKWIKE